MSRFHRLTTLTDLEAALAAPGPALLFLYDPFCPINDVARGELETLGADIAFVDVAADHALGMEVERLTGVRHESPQLIVHDGGCATWHAAHSRIRAAAVRAAMAAAPAVD